MREGWALKVAQEFAIWGLVVYKPVAYKKRGLGIVIKIVTGLLGKPYIYNFLNDSKFYNNIKAETGKKDKNRLRTFWGLEVQKQKIKITLIHTSFWKY